MDSHVTLHNTSSMNLCNNNNNKYETYQSRCSSTDKREKYRGMAKTETNHKKLS